MHFGANVGSLKKSCNLIIFYLIYFINYTLKSQWLNNKSIHIQASLLHNKSCPKYSQKPCHGSHVRASYMNILFLVLYIFSALSIVRLYVMFCYGSPCHEKVPLCETQNSFRMIDTGLAYWNIAVLIIFFFFFFFFINYIATDVVDAHNKNILLWCFIMETCDLLLWSTSLYLIMWEHNSWGQQFMNNSR